MTIAINAGINDSVKNFNQGGANNTVPLKTRRKKSSSFSKKNTWKPWYATFVHNRLQQDLERYVEPWSVKYVAPAIAGDVEAAFSLYVSLRNEKRGEVAVAFWRAKVPVPAFAELLGAVWGHDHGFLMAAAKTRSRLHSMFRYANYQIPEELPATVQVWRGTSGITANQASKGLSWSTDRDTACWFAMRFAANFGQPLVLSAVIERNSILFYDQGRGEGEVVLFDVHNAIIDGTPIDWRERANAKIAERQAEQEEWVKAHKTNSSSNRTGNKMDFNEASSIYFKHIEANELGVDALQPNKHLSVLTRGIWYLRNVNGLLARVGTVKKQVFATNSAG